MITPEMIADKMRADYGDEHLESLAEHFPKQFAHIAKITLYYISQNEQRLQRDQADQSASGLQQETGG